MGKKSAAKRSVKKAVPATVAATVVATSFEAELSYDEMLTELEAIVSEANLRLEEEECTF